MYKNKLICLLILLLTGCSLVTKPQIIQGNIITPEMVSRLHVGMTPPQVVNVMGTPVLANIFSPNRMEYVYTYQDLRTNRKETRVSCLFQNGSLKEIYTFPRMR